jgi:hypothetical protein
MNKKLSKPQEKLLAQARSLAKVSDHPGLVSGYEYQTACALERRGLGSVRYQGPGSRGWFTVFETAVNLD